MSLALGSGEAMNLRPYGLSDDHPLDRLRELFPAIRGLLTATPDKRYSQSGEFTSMDEAYLQLPGAPIPKLYLAGNGPKNRHIAGTLADGWIPLLLSPELYAQDLEEILSHREKAGLAVDTFDPAYQLDFALAPTAEEGRAMLVKTVKSLLHAFPRKAARLGVDVTREFDWHDLIPRPDTQARMERRYASVDDAIVDRTSVFGDKTQCLEMIIRFHEAGCRHLIVRSANPVEEVCAFFRDHVFPAFHKTPAPRHA
jgi:phthiodiolone/phenolphthiodiolone dimycocerosates ketoreductase